MEREALTERESPASTGVVRIRLRELALQGALQIALIALMFPGVFLRGEVAIPGRLIYDTQIAWQDERPQGLESDPNVLTFDAISAFHLQYKMVQDSFEAGEWPFWNPFMYAGMPLLANFQSTVFYPPRLLHSLLDIATATTLYVLLKLWLCGLTAYVSGRMLGLGTGASRFFSVAWMFSGYNLIWTYWPLPDVSAWVPLLFVAAEFIAIAQYRRGFFLMAFAATLFLLAGHPESAFAFGIGVGQYFLLRVLWEHRLGRNTWKAIAVAGGAWALALAVCAAQLAPFVEYLVNSSTFYDRAIMEGQEKGYPAGVLPVMLVPRFYGVHTADNFWGVYNYNFLCMAYGGVSVWVAATMLCARAYRGRLEISRIVSVLVPGLVGLALAFDAPPFEAINALPLFSSMWYFYHMSIAMFALALLAGVSVERWFCRARHFRELLHPLPLLLILAAIPAYAYFFNATLMKMMKVAEYTTTQCFYATCIAGVALLVFALSCFITRPRALAFALTALVAADLLFAVRDMYTPTPRSALFPETELTRALRAEGPLTRFEVLVATGITPGLLSIYELEEWEGYDGMYPARIWSLLSGLKKDAWIAMEPAFAVTHYLHDPRMKDPPIPIDEPGRLEYVRRMDSTDLYRNPKAFNRAFLVGALQTTRDLDEMLAVMKSEDFDPAKVALTDSVHGETRRLSDRDNLGSAEVTRRTFTHVKVEVKAEDACVLCLSEAYYPGWDVRINGEEGEIIPVYHAFRGVILPKAGEYRVEFSYFPRSFIVGLSISVITMVFSCGWAFFILWRGTRARA